LWLSALFQTLEQQASKEANHTINILNCDEQQGDIDDKERVWKQANDLARRVAARQVRLRNTMNDIEYLDAEVVQESRDVALSAPALIESTHQWNKLKKRFAEILEESHEALCRAEKVTSTFLAYVQLNESRQAIRQTESVRRLTNLAFSFLPLSLVAGIFSADIREMDGHRSATVFAASRILTTAIAIIAALTLEQYFYVWFSWPFLKWRAWMFRWISVDNRRRIMRGSSAWFWLADYRNNSIIEIMLLWQSYAKRRARRNSEAIQEDGTREG